MFLESFEQQNSKHEFKRKQIKKQYSAGFRNYHPQKIKIDEEMNAQSDNDIFQKLKIGNLKQLYQQTLPKADYSKIASEQQKQSIMRLTKMPEKQQKCEINNEQDEQKRKEKIQIFNKTYHKAQGYSQKGQKMLFKNQYKKIKQKLSQIANKISIKESFNDLIVKFVLNNTNKYSGKLKIESDELCLEFNNFINSLRRQQKQNDKAISSGQLQDLTYKNLFFFGFFNTQKIKVQKLQFNNLLQLINQNSDFQQKIQQIRHFIHKKITVPFQSTSIYPQTKTKPVQINQNEEVFQKFHAKPIPKTTYQKPKERPKSQMTKTQPQPFNLANTNVNVPKIQDYYKWQRQFHAKEVPATTYKPVKIQAGNEDEKVKRALQLLHSSKYPESMKYLNNYKNYNQQKVTQLQKKYSKKRVQQQHKSVPNFAQIHRRHTQMMENTKTGNRQLTKTQPFNLSQPRPLKPQKEAFVPQFVEKQPYVSPKRQVQDKQRSKLQLKSTLKYDSYVNHLKKQKQTKIEQQELKKKDQQKKQKPQYKQILKERLQDKIKGKIKNSSPPKLQDNVVKVNLQKIYQYQPLLIEREAMKNKKQAQSHIKKWSPII